MRYFRTSDASVYEQARAMLDAAWSLPAHGCTCITPAASAPRDSAGRIVLAVHDEFCTYSVAADLLPPLLASGDVEEIDAETYSAAVAAPSIL